MIDPRDEIKHLKEKIEIYESALMTIHRLGTRPGTHNEEWSLAAIALMALSTKRARG